ncbi:uncharacterized protein LOC136038417 [Artemia franciscana]|uniref:uncharacterized protein LOC136038417 n=1 Tax=Artemia franciscana TaxID=6661 RepID=UPI0032DBEC5A
MPTLVVKNDNDIRVVIKNDNIRNASGTADEPSNAAKLNSSSFAPLLVKYFPPTCLRAAIDSEWSEQSSVDVLKEPVSVSVASRILEIHFVHCYPKWPTKTKRCSRQISKQEQLGFKKGVTDFDRIFTLRSISEKCLSCQTTLVLSFIDYEQVFDSVDRRALAKFKDDMSEESSKASFCNKHV